MFIASYLCAGVADGGRKLDKKCEYREAYSDMSFVSSFTKIGQTVVV